MDKKVIKQYDAAKGYTCGVKLPPRTFSALKKTAIREKKTVNDCLHDMLSKAKHLDPRKVILKADGIVAQKDGKCRVKLTKEQYSWLEQVQAEHFERTDGEYLLVAVVLDLILTGKTELSDADTSPITPQGRREHKAVKENQQTRQEEHHVSVAGGSARKTKKVGQDENLDNTYA